MITNSWLSVDDKLYNYIKSDSTWIPLNGLTTKELYNYLRTTYFSVERKKRINSVENKRIPSLILTFYGIMIEKENKEPASLNQYVSNYLKLHQKWIKENSLEVDALAGRLSRAYPSLIRDLEFYLRLKESKLFERVSYNIDEDLNEEIDITIQKVGIEYGLQLRIKSKNSDKYYKIKPNRQKIKRNKILVDMPLDIWGQDVKVIKTKGQDLYIYPEDSIDKVFKKIG